ncbi:PilN domain-containing protein [Sphingobium sp. CAP-1]|uniref:PilN domain-containing protein n=1 Tax=Sphingobium sp. CAP-1 TaxID=2676077 RepID=UPI0012BB369E|nr:PilN domain-containing protein [Sphingobium sp. CAP-1]QGP80474.1 hypothetical protein GL174_15175 [Sphingobium sp. CAP-1]
MTLRDILSADMPTLRRWLAQGWEWWTDQIAAMLPGKAWRSRHRGALIERDPTDPCGWRIAGGGGSATLLPDRQRRNLLATLQPNDILCRIIDAPPLGRSELRQMLALDIDRIGPIPQEQAVFDFDIIERGEDRLAVRIAMVPRDRLLGWIGSLDAMGITPTRIALSAEGGHHFDFLKAAGLSRRDSHRGTWWVAVALFFALNLGALVWRDVAALNAMAAAVEEQAPAGRTALLIRQRIDKEQQRRLWLARARAQQNPLPLLTALTAALPQGAWVQRLEFHQRQVRLVGFAPGATDVADALRQSSRLRAIVENDAESPPAAAADQMRAFDISAVYLPVRQP